MKEINSAKSRGIIFDLDGTLWDSSAQVIPAWNRVLEKYNQAPIDEEILAGLMGLTGEEIAVRTMPALSREEALAVFEKCCEEEQSFLCRNGGTLYPRMEETLKKLSGKYSLFIVSNCHPDYMEAFFKAHGLRKYFTDSECHGRTGLSKAENIKLIIKRNKLSRAVYVGDTDMDRAAALGAELPFVFAAYGFGKLENEIYTISEPWELTDLVESIL